MTDRPDEAVLHEVLDGEAGPETEARLLERLASDPAARERFEELRSLFHTLDHVGTVEPPEDLRAEVLRAIRRERGGSGVHPWEAARVAWGRSTLPRAVLPFAAGLLIGVLGYATLIGGPPDRAGRDLPATATMGGALEHIERAEIVAGPSRVVIETRRAGGRVEVDIQGGSGGTATEVTLEWNPTGLRSTGYQWLRQAPGWVTVGTRQCRLQQRGVFRGRLSFEAAGPETMPLRVVVRSPGGAAERELATSSGGPRP